MLKKIRKPYLIAGVSLLLLIGVTGAFFQSDLPVTNPFSTGNAQIYMKEKFESDDKWVPGEEKQKEVKFGNDGDTAVVMRASFRPSLKLANGKPVTDPEILNGFVLNYADIFEEEWEQHGDWYYYKKVLEPGEETDITLASVLINRNIGNDVHEIQTDYSGAVMDVKIENEALQSTVTKDSTELQNWEYYPYVNRDEQNALIEI